MTTVRGATATALLVSSAAVVSLTTPGLAGAGPVATDDEATVTLGGAVVIDVLANDYDPGSDPSPLEITGVTRAPDGGTATAAPGSIEYLSDGVFVGTDTFGYQISDGEITAEATVTITVSDSINEPPVVTDDTTSTVWGTPVTVDVAANDSDPEGEDLTVIALDPPDHGRAELTGGQVTYTPVGEYTGSATMTYTVQDALGAQASGTLTVDVQPRFAVDVRKVGAAVAGHRSLVHGVVSTRLDGPVTAVLERWNGERWRELSERIVRGDDRFELRWRPEQPGAAALRLTARWETGGHLAASARERVQVTARFDPVVSRITAKDVPHTWRPGCPVGPAGLRAIDMNYWDYRGRLQRGRLIGAAWVVADYLAVFRRAFEAGFPIKKMYPADRYGGDDKRAMRAGNTSAFNCRHVTGNPYRMSQHSYGNAIDINTFENPYVTGSHVYPPKAALPYYHRREDNLRDPGVITARSSIARALWDRGWVWGARWAFPDYQHWSSNGG